MYVCIYIYIYTHVLQIAVLRPPKNGKYNVYMYTCINVCVYAYFVAAVSCF